MTEKLYFDFENDLFNSATAKRMGINNTTNNPKILSRLMNLTWYLLNPLRVLIGKPVIVECAYRCPDLNTVLGGASTGHPEGYCADIKVNGWTQEKLFRTIVDFIRQKKITEFDQIIWEKDSNCLHVSYKHANNRKELLIRTKSGNVYNYERVIL